MMDQNRKILLINASLSPKHKRLSDRVFPHTALMLLATVLDKAGWNVRILDGNLHDLASFKQVVYDELTGDTLYIGFSVMTNQIPWAYDVTEYIKSIAPEIPIVWGGVHPTLYPEQTAADSNVDIVVVNEALSNTILPLTRALANHTSLDEVPGLCYRHNDTIVRTQAPSLDRIEDVPFIDFSLMDHRHYAAGNVTFNFYPDDIPAVDNIAYPIVTGLGCPYRCRFCINVILKRRYRGRSASEIVDRIEFLQDQYGANFIWAMDEDFLTNKRRILQFVDLVERRKLKFYFRAWLRVDHFRDGYIDVELANRLYNVGLIIAVMGAESGSQRILNYLNKGITPEQIRRASATLAQTRIVPRYSFMVGFPDETEQDLAETREMARRLRDDNPKSDVQILNYCPFPGSPMYDQIRRDYSLREPESLYAWSRLAESKGYARYFPIEESTWISNPDQVKDLVYTHLYK